MVSLQEITIGQFVGAAASNGAAPGGGASSLLMLALFFLAFWFLMIAPQRKRQKAQEKMISELKTGDQVITSSGILGTIANVKKDTFIIKSADGTKLEIYRSFVQTKISNKNK